MAEKFIGFVSRGAGLQTFYEGLVKIGFVSSRAVAPMHSTEAVLTEALTAFIKSRSGRESLVEVIDFDAIFSAHYGSMELPGLGLRVTQVAQRV
jgi:hypothetical protein